MGHARVSGARSARPAVGWPRQTAGCLRPPRVVGCSLKADTVARYRRRRRPARHLLVPRSRFRSRVRASAWRFFLLTTEAIELFGLAREGQRPRSHKAVVAPL